MPGKIRKRVQNKFSLYSYSVFSFAALLLGAILLACILIIPTINMLTVNPADRAVEQIKKQKSKLENGRYKELRLRPALGDAGFFEIVTADGKILYTSSKKDTGSMEYTSSDFRYMPKVGGNIYYQLEPSKDSGGTDLSRISVYQTTDKTVLKGDLLFDSNYNVIYSTIKFDGKDPTKKALKFMVENASTMSSVQKYKFLDKDGEVCYLLIHIKESSASYDARVANHIIFILVAFVSVITLLIIVLALKLSKTIRRPIDALSDAMENIGQGKSREIITNDGPKEFSRIVNTFNNMQQRLQESEEKQEKLQKEKQKMLADISHDLKTPVTVIQGYASAVADGIVDKDDEARYLRTISKKADQLTYLINSFNEFNRLEHPDFNLQCEVKDICEFFREYLAGKYEELDLAGYPLEIDIPDEKIYANFDPNQFARVFENIISNSTKHTEPGTRIFAIMKREGPDKIRIVIGDHGHGIPKELRNSVFDPFVVGNESRTSGKGTGLGLSIARRIVELHGGSITLGHPSEYGRGTSFVIILTSSL